MIKLELKEETYKVKYGYNSFCDTDLLDNVSEILQSMTSDEEATPKKFMGALKDTFTAVRALLFVGLQKYHSDKFTNPSVVGDFMDDYIEENEITVQDMFNTIIVELVEQGFLKDILAGMEEETTPKPQDHKKSTKK